MNSITCPHRKYRGYIKFRQGATSIGVVRVFARLVLLPCSFSYASFYTSRCDNGYGCSGACTGPQGSSHHMTYKVLFFTSYFYSYQDLGFH